jgi:hypothetical protein
MSVDRRDRCVRVTNGEIEAEQVRSLLAGSGIECEFRGEALRNTFGLTLDGLGRVEILVSAADEERARELLESAEAGELSLSGDAEPPSS